MDTKEHPDPLDDECTAGLVELGAVSRDTRGFLLGFFSDAGLGRRMLPI